MRIEAPAIREDIPNPPPPKYDHDRPKSQRFYRAGRKPQSKLYRQYDEYCKQRKIGTKVKPTALEALCLTDINLITRKQVGIVLGSIAADLAHPPKDLSTLNTHKDLDVLVLGEDLTKVPRPHEWGVDWWVKEPGATPTNSSVSLWYDISLDESVEIDTKIKRDTPLNLDSQNGDVTYDPCTQSPEPMASETLIPPGLYLPDSSMLRAIAEFCEARVQRVVEIGETVADNARSIVKFRIFYLDPKILREEIQFMSNQGQDKIVDMRTLENRASFRSRPAYLELIEQFYTEIKNFHTKHNIKMKVDYGSKSIIEYAKHEYSRSRLDDNHQYSRTSYAYDKAAEYFSNMATKFRENLHAVRSDYSYLYTSSSSGNSFASPLFPVLDSKLLTLHTPHE